MNGKLLVFDDLAVLHELADAFIQSNLEYVE